MDHQCFCQVNEDGRCEHCIKDLMDSFMRVASLFREFEKRFLEGIAAISRVCKTCTKTNFDLVLSKFMSEILADYPPAAQTQVMQSLIAYAKGEFGLTAMPLMEKAMADLERKKSR